jgi:RimJ/RimL family protein N-acetyltransferase
MTSHIIVYKGIHMSLALMQRMYGPEYLPWPNRRTAINGTLQRPPYYPEDFDEWIERLRKSKGVHEVFAVLAHEDTETGRGYRYLGHAGIHHVEWPSGHATTGSVLGADNAREKGYGTEAKLWMQYHAFKVLGLRKLLSEVKAFNAPSLGHLLKCGYKVIGRRKAHDFHEGAYVDVIVLECFREDWEPIWERYRASGTLPKLTAQQRTRVTKETNQST